MLLQHGDVGERAYPAADVTFEERPAHQQALPADSEAHPVAAALVPPALRGYVGGDGAIRDQILGEAGEQPSHDHEPPWQKGVRVAGLRHTLAVLAALGEAVPLDYGDALEVIREDARGQKSGHAAPDHDSVAMLRLNRSRLNSCVFLSS